MSSKIINIDNLKHYNDKINQTKQDVLVSGQNIKTLNGESIIGEGDIKLENSILPLTYSELVSLRDNSQLIPGQQYRITDYVTTTVQENTQSAGHQFDIIVTADDESTLNEVARAIQHDGDTYFTDSDLNAWKIWYCIDNDTERFEWAIDFAFLRSGLVYTWNGNDNDSSGSLMYEWEAADGSMIYTKTLTPQMGEICYDDTGVEDGIVEDIIKGKGVIYRMIDEFNNDCPYDFKNIQFIRYELNAPETDDTEPWMAQLSANIQAQFSNNQLSYIWGGFALEDTRYWDDDRQAVYSIPIGNKKAFYTFSTVIDDVVTDHSLLQGYCYDNTMKEYIESEKQYLNNNVFLNTSKANSCHSNSFEHGCQFNSFGANSGYNSLGAKCESNSFGNYCSHNSFENNCHNNFFGHDCDGNSFGNNCYYNSFENNCWHNSFGHECFYNSFGYHCESNSFGNYCWHNSFEYGCQFNSFGNYCWHNSFGHDCDGNSFGNVFKSNSFGYGCESNSFGNDCNSNSFGNDCNSNSFGNVFKSNSFGNYCSRNSFGNYCSRNSFGADYYYNSFGNYCSANSFGHDCDGNSFGNNCHNNFFGNYCDGNSFGNNCYYNSFRVSANKSSALKNYIRYNHFDDGCSYNVIWNGGTTGSGTQLQNINVNRGVSCTGGSYNMINIAILNSEKEINVINYNEHIYIDYGDIFNVTYSELWILRENSQLIPGRQYRIIDYVTTTSQENTQSAGHPFDVIVTALDEYNLSEEAQAIQNINDGYFDDSNLSAWKIWYSIDNDTNRFEWAGSEITTSEEVEVTTYDSSECTINPELIDGNAFITPFNFESCVWVDDGGGVYEAGSSNHDAVELIYEWGYFTDENDNTQLCLYKSDAGLYEEEGQPDYGDKYLYRGVITVDGTDYDYWQKWDENNESINNVGETGDYVYATTSRIVSNPEAYSFETTNETVETVIQLNPKGVIYRMIDEFNNDVPYDFKNIQFKHPKDTTTYPDYYYTFSTVIDDVVTDHSLLEDYCYGNTMKEYIHSTKQILNFNVFLNISKLSNCHNNSFEHNCYNNSFEHNCHNNSFEHNCHNNSFEHNCHNNSFGNSCSSNSFGNSCSSNSFGYDCFGNKFGNNCKFNSFGNNCNGNKCGNYYQYNSFGYDCFGNEFGNNCKFNSFGNECDRNSFRASADKTATLKDYVQYNHFDDGCSFNVIWNNDTTSSSVLLKNVNVNRGVAGTSKNAVYNMINIDTLNSEKEINVNNYNGHIYIDYGDIFNVTYASLKTLRDNSQLIPGRQYRIIDYITTTAQENTQSTGHQFDLIVLATDKDKLAEEAQAIQNINDSYFDDSNLSAWQIWYCLDNDTERFAWADSENGKGVIYRMIDEWNNDCPYDFKNIQFKRCKVTSDLAGADLTTLAQEYVGYTLSGYGASMPVHISLVDTSDYKYIYTFSCVNNGSIIDASLGASGIDCYDNSMKPYIVDIAASNVQYLNDIVMYAHPESKNQCITKNTFGSDCFSMTLGCEQVGEIWDNHFGQYCRNNILVGPLVYQNDFDSNLSACYFSQAIAENNIGLYMQRNFVNNVFVQNDLGPNCKDNIFMKKYYSNRIGEQFMNNNCNDEFYQNTLGSGCMENTFNGKFYANVSYNSFIGNTINGQCNCCEFGTQCTRNTLGIFRNSKVGSLFMSNVICDTLACVFGVGFNCNNVTATKMQYSTFGTYVMYNNWTSSGNVNNINVSNNLQGTTSNYNNIEIPADSACEVKVSKNSAGEIKIYCEADLIA